MNTGKAMIVLALGLGLGFWFFIMWLVFTALVTIGMIAFPFGS